MPNPSTNDGPASAFPSTSRRTFVRAAAMASLGGAATSFKMAAQATPEVPVTVWPEEPPVRLAISPQHGTRTASAHTTISFRGEAHHHLGVITVEGSRSGIHSGVLVPHPDGMGVSWLPDDWFEPGEYVSVTADIPLTATLDGGVRFRVATQAPRISVAPTEETTPVEPDGRFHGYVSRPDLTPPVINVTTPPTNAAPGHIFLTPSLPGGNHGRVIVDETGEPIWFGKPAQRNDGNLCLKLEEYGGQPVLVWWEGAKTQGYGFGHWVIADTSYETIARVQAGNGISGLDCHDLIITPQGTAISIAYNPVNWNLTSVGGGYSRNVADGVIQEIDIETGMVLWEWHSLDHIVPSESYFSVPQNEEVPWDYIHFNSVALDHDGHLLLSARHSHAAYKVNRQTGEVIWRLSGKLSDFTMGPNTWFAWAHDVQRQPDGTISLFDNHENNQDLNSVADSRALFLDLDEAGMSATLAREIIHETGILSVSQANVQRLDNGNVFIGWGSSPVFSEHDETNGLVYNGRLPANVQSYRAYRHEWVGYPSTAPDVAVRMGDVRGMTVWVSWNGATEVAEWRVLGGTSSDRMLEIARVQKDGFETRVEVADTTDWVVIEARDTHGQPLGMSEPTPLRG